ncbi:MAG: WD40 repeat domain-containing protein [Thermoflexibacter sp.]|nr:WD40 repeat domain-containing protein [Thermoflexibacter sp.]
MSNIQIHKVRTLTGHHDSIYALIGSANTQEIFSGGSDGFVVRWNLEQGDQGTLIVRIPNSVYALHLDKSRNCLIIGQNYSGVHLISLEDNKEISSSSITSSAIFDIKVYKDMLLVGCGDGTISILSLSDLTTIAHLKMSAKSVRCMAVNPLSEELAVGYSDNFIRIIDLKNLSIRNEIEAHQNSVFSLSYSPDYQYLLSGSRDAYLKVWNAENRYLLHREIVAHLFTINHICYHPHLPYFATCSKDKSIKLWDAKEFKLLKVIDKARHTGHGTSINKLFWSNYHNYLFACSDDRTISVWDISII